MAADQDKLVLGYRWVAERGKEACERCAALDGQEFYYHPGPGQRSVDGAPEPPLHPNCRCATVPILALEDRLQRSATAPDGDPTRTPDPVRPSRSAADTQGGFTICNVVFNNQGRSILDGPAYGNYGGKNWMIGRNVDGCRRND